MKTIDKTDTIFATVTARGTTFVSLRLSGITSMNEVVSSLREAIGTTAGLMTMTVRNGSQGWVDRRNMMFI